MLWILLAFALGVLVGATAVFTYASYALRTKEPR